MHPLERRRRATVATRDRFVGRPFEWGRNDCARMAIHLVRGLGMKVSLARMGGYRSALGARRALTRLGYTSLAEALDARFERIPPAAAIAGDLMLLPGDDAFGALVVAVGNGRVLGWHEDVEGAAMLQPTRFEAAWRTL